MCLNATVLFPARKHKYCESPVPRLLAAKLEKLLHGHCGSVNVSDVWKNVNYNISNY